MIQSQVYINAADMVGGIAWEEQVGNPSAHQDYPIAILAQQVNYFKQNAARRLYQDFVVIFSGLYHWGFIT